MSARSWAAAIRWGLPHEREMLAQMASLLFKSEATEEQRAVVAAMKLAGFDGAVTLLREMTEYDNVRIRALAYACGGQYPGLAFGRGWVVCPVGPSNRRVAVWDSGRSFQPVKLELAYSAVFAPRTSYAVPPRLALACACECFSGSWDFELVRPILDHETPKIPE